MIPAFPVRTLMSSISAVLLLIVATVSADETTFSYMLKSADRITVHAPQVEITRLLPDDAKRVMQSVLKSLNQIAGFPISDNLQKISPADIKVLRAAILNPSHYAHVRLRCANQWLVGIRFSSDAEITEFAYGLPCRQAFWAIKIDGETHFNSAILGSEYGDSILRILGVYETKAEAK